MYLLNFQPPSSAPSSPRPDSLCAPPRDSLPSAPCTPTSGLLLELTNRRFWKFWRRRRRIWRCTSRLNRKRIRSSLRSLWRSARATLRTSNGWCSVDEFVWKCEETESKSGRNREHEKRESVRRWEPQRERAAAGKGKLGVWNEFSESFN